MSTSWQSKYMYPFTALLTVNFKHFMFTRRVILPFLIFSVPVVVMFVWRVFAGIAEPPPGSPIGDPYLRYTQTAALLYLHFIIPLIALSQGTALLSEEWQAGTMLLLQIRPVPRWVISAGKLAAYFCCTGILLTISLTMIFLIAASLPDSGMIPADLPVLFRDLRIFGLGLAAYGSVMMLIGIYFKRPLMIGILFLFVWDQFASILPGYAPKLTVRYYLQSLSPNNSVSNTVLERFSAATPVSALEATLVLFGIIIGGVILSSVVFSRKTVLPESQ